MIIKSANIYYNEHQTPTSSNFDDVYFSNDNGVQETDYVFIEGNDLWQQWLRHNEAHFCIMETGFGTGLNFFRTLQWFHLFQYYHPQHKLKKLHFISTEKFPLAKEDLIKVFKQWHENQFFVEIIAPTSTQTDCTNNSVSLSPEPTKLNGFISKALRCAMQTWLDQYPSAVQGVHRRHFKPVGTGLTNNVNITLDLHYGDAIESFDQVKTNNAGIAHAWFLDGFAPSKNDSMWQNKLFAQMARLSLPKASFATFTAAGFVKRALRDAGFIVNKQKGFGRKREMLVGFFGIDSVHNTLKDFSLHKCSSLNAEPSLSQKSQAICKHHAPYYGRESLSLDTIEVLRSKKRSSDKPTIDEKSTTKNVVTIVGNGLAGALTALKLVEQGIAVHMMWQGKHPADGASGNPVGGFYPQLNAQNNYASQIQLHSFLYAYNFYKTLNQQQPFEHNWCGALQLGFNANTKERLTKLANKALWPHDVAEIVSSQQASEIANIPIPYTSLHLPNAGIISVPSLVHACISQANKSGLLTMQAQTTVHQYDLKKNHIQLNISHPNNANSSTQNVDNKLTNTHQFDTSSLIIAMGDGAKPLVDSVIPLRLTRGQVEMVKSTGTLSRLTTLLCHKGYFTPAVQGFHALGSSYIKEDNNCEVRTQETEDNFNMHLQSMQDASWLDELSNASLQSQNTARAAVRCSSPDHLPVVGALPSEAQFDQLADLYKALPLHYYSAGSYQKNVFILSGLGSRGLTTAPLMAELLVSQMLGLPLPFPEDLLNALAPNRFLVRSLIRRQSF